MFSLGYTHFYKEIQTGVYQETVFGEKFRHGYSLMPSVEYKKHNLLVRNLDLTLTANYNHNFTNNVDTASRHYNWLGEYYDNGVRGEQAYQRSQSKNTNWNATGNLNYRFGRIHTLTFHHVASNFRRTSRSYTGTSSVLTAFDIPKVTRKNISGLSYRVVPSENGMPPSSESIIISSIRDRFQPAATAWATIRTWKDRKRLGIWSRRYILYL